VETESNPLAHPLLFCKYLVTFIYINSQTHQGNEENDMYTTVNEDGILNNYAPKVAVYCAEYPAVWEQRRYALQGAFATVFVGLMIVIAFSVSSLG
jgi:hypothetical protein